MIKATSRRKYVQKVVRVPIEDAEWFEEHYPMYGSWAWLVQTSLSNFRSLHETGPNDVLMEAVRASAIQKAAEAKEETEE